MYELKLAILSNNIELINFLIQNGYNLNVKNEEGHTALSVAMIKKNSEIAKFLIKNGAGGNSDPEKDHEKIKEFIN